VLAGAEFRSWIETHPAAALALLRTIIRRLRSADRRRTASGSLDATHRLAAFLVELVDQAGPHPYSDVDVDIALTQEELASLIGASRESVVRALAALRSRDLVGTGRRRITVVDVEGLRRFAGL
jgi:CRP/FNR family transcriptional regulator, cyclic AMP receptor protein